MVANIARLQLSIAFIPDRSIRGRGLVATNEQLSLYNYMLCLKFLKQGVK